MVFLVLRPLYKWILHYVYGQCELLRLVHYIQKGASRTKKIEYSLSQSKMLSLENILASKDLDDTVINIMEIKSISSKKYFLFHGDMKGCLQHICGYHQLIKDVEMQRKIPFSSEDSKHENLLTQLWNGLQPNITLESRISKQWGDIGFQGDDPKTDFRGMGILGLENLVYFVTQYQPYAQKLLSHSKHPKYGYSYAIVGINISFMTYTLLKDGHLKTHMYNSVHELNMDDFHNTYCYLFFEFDKFWLSNEPRDIMEFSRLQDLFNLLMIEKLTKNETILTHTWMQSYK